MTNYPRDEFDRVPEFSNRSGAHRATGWAAAAASGSSGSGLRWLMISGAFALVVGLFSFMLLPGLIGGQTGKATPPAAAPSATPTATKKPTPTKDGVEPTGTDSPEATAGSTQEPEATPSATSTIGNDPLVSRSTAIGVYNGSTSGGLAGVGSTTLRDEGFTQVSAGNWTKKVRVSSVYYRQTSSKATAEAAAAALGITSVLQTSNIPGEIAVVLGSDFIQ